MLKQEYYIRLYIYLYTGFYFPPSLLAFSHVHIHSELFTVKLHNCI